MTNSYTLPRRHASRRAGLFLVLLALVVPSLASAADRVVWKRQSVSESEGAWKVSMEIHLSRAPDIPHIPVRFTFTPVTYFERALVDGKKDPVVRKIPLESQQPIVESVDVGFMDPGTGKTAKRTRFSFHVTRDRGFDAGQYEVEVTNSHTGKKMGGKVTLTLNGDNPVVDRRSIVFDEKKKDEGESGGPKPAAPKEKTLTPQDDAFWEGGPRQPDEPEAPLPPPAHLQEKPGCGCRVGGEPARDGGASLAALGLALALIGRRRFSRGPRGGGSSAASANR
jgi:MYXO-CTERM domain-containing protein